MANETYWEVTFLDVDNTEKTETYNNAVDFYSRLDIIWKELNLPVLNCTSGSNR